MSENGHSAGGVPEDEPVEAGGGVSRRDFLRNTAAGPGAATAAFAAGTQAFAATIPNRAWGRLRAGHRSIALPGIAI